MEKGGLAAALSAAGITQASQLAWGDEMRIGLYYDHVRRVWAPRGVKVRQPRQMQRCWRYLALAVDVRVGRLTWCWVANMKGETLAGALRHWQAQGCQAVVWDGARGHHAPAVRQVGVTLIQQPPYAPELNPAEGVWVYLKRVELANVCCQDKTQLRYELRRAVKRLRQKPQALLGCLKEPGIYV